MGRSLVNKPTTPWDPPALDGHDSKQVTPYPRQLWEYAYIWIFVSVRSITSIPPRSTARAACVSPKPRLPRMFSVPMSGLVRRGGRRRSGGGALCRRSAPWRIGWENVSAILVGPGKKWRKRKENSRIGYCRIYGRYFSVAPFSSTGRHQYQGAAISGVTGRLMRGRIPPNCFWPRFHL